MPSRTRILLDLAEILSPEATVDQIERVATYVEEQMELEYLRGENSSWQTYYFSVSDGLEG